MQARCGCRGECANKPPQGAIYGKVWSHCPVALTDGAWWQSVRALDALQSLQPIEHWPSGYSIGASSAMVALANARRRAAK
jgi:hypothetical protein